MMPFSVATELFRNEHAGARPEKMTDMLSARPHAPRHDTADLRALGRRLRELRVDLTQEEMAKELKISQSQLSKYERGVSAPTADVLFFMKKSFEVSIDWLLTGEGPRRNPGDQ